jgi:membrane protein YqaA with SNARE-associated domain
LLPFYATWFFATLFKSLLHLFLRLGVFGLLILSFLDSSFLVLPFGNDLLLIAIVSSNRTLIHTILYVLVSSIGSVLGVLLVDLIMRKAGEQGLEHFVKPRKIKRLKARMDTHAGWALLAAALVPPPFPFTAVVMTASALQYSRKKLLITVFAGRLLRFGIEGTLAMYFGRQVLTILNSKMIEYVVYGIIVIAGVGSVLSVIRWVGSRKHRGSAKPQEQGELA